MKCSIILPVYNMEDYILRALKSLQDQSYDNLEVIIIDDGSSDSSARLIREFIRFDSRFRYFYFENGGLGRARNIGLSIATGKFITFLDADDWLDTDYLQDCTLIKEKEDVVIQNRLFHYSDTVQSIKYPTTFDNYFQDINISCTNKIFSLDYVRSFRFHEAVLYEDVVFHLNVVKRGPNFKLGSSYYNVEKRNEKSITSNISDRHIDLLTNIEACGVIAEDLSLDIQRDFQNYSFWSSLYLISKFKECSLAVMRHYKIFTLALVLRRRFWLRVLLLTALVCPPVLWLVFKRLRLK